MGAIGLRRALGAALAVAAAHLIFASCEGAPAPGRRSAITEREARGPGLIDEVITSRGILQTNSDLDAGLISAAQEGNLEEVQRLLEQGADIEATNSAGATPLIEASYGGHIEVVRHLLGGPRVQGANVSAQDALGFSSLHCAAQEGYLVIAKDLLVAGAPVEQVTVRGSTPLLLAAQGGQLPLVKELLQAGANPGLVDRDGATPLYKAAQEGHREVAKNLLEAGADVEGGIAKRKVTPLIVAAQAGHLNVVEELISRGANVGARDISGVTALHVSPVMLATDGELTGKLVAHGADPTLPDGADNQPLHWAAEFGNKAAAEVLLRAGADGDARSGDGRLPHELVCICTEVDPTLEAALTCDKGACSKKDTASLKKFFKNAEQG
ncbi:unnamed protein product [Ostreobium quekettii]|uniref:Ankyrin repeat domain-containing protein n=1 Tax=Ostreobium quekettii TaxID=121088 RepID=A0A8S1JDA5_9CHLO|nr:unnamed protein product [Ostreobium quekettii]|eukprot:evm.model.scf_1021.3 EVM.evm.TU.scf_1021.3   scf_1021:40030-46288(-)